MMRRPLSVSLSLLLGGLVTYPLLRFLLLPLWPALGPSVIAPTGQGPGLGEAAATSVLLAAAAAACAVPPSVWLGTLIERRRWRGRSLLLGAMLMLFLMPGYLVAAGWQIVAGSEPVGALPWLRDALLGWPGLIFLLALKSLPVATLAVALGWTVGQPRLEEAARLHVANRWHRWRLIVRPIGPAAATAFLIVFVEAMHDYGLASTVGARLHLKLLVTEVYASLAAWPISWTRAAEAGDLLIAVSLAPLLLRVLLGSRSIPPLDRALAPMTRPASRGEAVAGGITCGLLFAAGSFVPLLALAVDAFSPEAAAVPAEAWASLGRSALYSFVGALGAVGLACAVLAATTGERWQTAFMWLPLGNLAVPGIVLGAADVIAFNGPPLPMIGTPLALLLAQIATQFPLLALFLRAPMRAQTGRLGDAARVHGIGVLDRVERLYLPPLVRPLAWAGALAFGRLFFELPLAQMLAPAGGEPVGVALVQLQQGLRFAAEARLALAAVLVCGAVVSVVLVAAERAQ